VTEYSSKSHRSTRASLRLSRRHVLRGVGVALTLPWLPSLAPRDAAAQTNVPKRYLPIYMPNGASVLWWRTTGAGAGASWQLSPLLAAFEPIKSKMLLLRQLGNFTWRDDLLTMNPGWTGTRTRNDFCGVCEMPNGAFIVPSHSRDPSAMLNCIDGDSYRSGRGQNPASSPLNGETVDQLIARSMPKDTALASMQLGLLDGVGSLDERHSALSRNMSWSNEGTPLGKDLDPGAVFDRIVNAGAGSSGMDQAAIAEAERRRALDLSALDAITDGTTALQSRLGQGDRERLDQFLTGVRELETKANTVVRAQASCELPMRPGMVSDAPLRAQTMNDLIVLAFQCDVTRVVSYMLDNSRSDMVYSWVQRRDYENGGAAVGGTATAYHESQHHTGTSPDFASITRWHIEVAADLLQKLDAVQDGVGEQPMGSLLDNSVVQFSSDMHHGDHASFDLPFALFGGKGVLRQDELVQLPEAVEDIRQLRDVYFTLLNEYFKLDVQSFGADKRGIPNALITEILA
jgi:Protein of unknown function (DUF1552)